MHIAIISGSHRKGSQSARIAHYLAVRLLIVEPTASADVIELTGNPLPLWDDENNSRTTSPELQKIWDPYATRLQAADGLIVVSPEWHGMVPAGLKNFFVYWSPKEVGHKPALITTVSASINGAYPVNELRTSGYKNSRLCYIPEQLIIRNAATIFNGDTPSGKDDEYLRGRADFALKILVEYTKALKPVRESGITFDKRYASGM